MRVVTRPVRSLVLSVLIIGAVAFLAPRPAHACIDYKSYLHWEGGVTIDGGAVSAAIAVAGSLACVIDERGLFLVDVRDASHPLERGSLTLPGIGAGVALYGETALVAADSAGLVVVDVHDPTLPSIVTTIPLSEPAASVAVSGVDAFVATAGSPSRLYAFDISNPASPRLLGSLDTIGESACVTAVGNRAFIAAGTTGLHVIDVSSPSAPVLLGTVDTPGTAAGVAVSGTTAYVADSDRGLQVVDFSNPASPRITASVPLPGTANAVAVSGTDVLLACGAPALVDVDLSEPMFPRIGGRTGTVGFTWGIALYGQRAYLAAGPRLLQIANIENPRNPDPTGTTGLTDNVYDLAVVGADAYVAEGATGVEIVSATQASSPTRIGILATSGPAISVAVGGEDRLYIGVEGVGVLAADLTNPTAPVILGRTNVPTNPKAMVASGTVLLVAGGGDGFYLIDVSDASAPTVTATVRTPFQAVGVGIVGSEYACVVDNLGGLLVYDILDPHAPALIGQYRTGGAIGVAVNGPTVFLADATGLQVLDLSIPATPTLQGRVDLGGRPWKLAAVGTTVYVAGEDNGLQIVDTQDPTKPSLHGEAFLNRARVLCPTNVGLFIGTWDATFWIMPLQCEIVPVYFPDLSAEVEGDGVRIRWEIGTDLNFDGFVVERADDDVTYVPLNADAPVPGRGPFEYLDRSAVARSAYSYRVAGLAPGGDRIISGPIRVVFEPARLFALYPPAPNPARGGTVAVRYALDRAGPVRLSLIDPAGRRVRILADAVMTAGTHRIDWDGLDVSGRRVAAGVYWIRLEADGREASTRMTVLP